MTKPVEVKIHLTPSGQGSSVEIDGQRMRLVRSIEITADANANNATLVRLEIINCDVQIEGAPGQIQIQPIKIESPYLPFPVPGGPVQMGEGKPPQILQVKADAMPGAVGAIITDKGLEWLQGRPISEAEGKPGA